MYNPWNKLLVWEPALNTRLLPSFLGYILLCHFTSTSLAYNTVNIYTIHVRYIQIYLSIHSEMVYFSKTSEMNNKFQFHVLARCLLQKTPAAICFY